MILDTQLAFDGTSSAFVAITVTRDSTNVLDMGVVRDMAIGDQLAVAIFSNRLFAAAGAATLTIAVQGSALEGSGYVTYAQSPAISIADLNSAVAGFGGLLFPIMLPRPPSGGTTRPRYYKLVYTVATGPFTAGAVRANLIPNTFRDDMQYYASGFSTANI